MGNLSSADSDEIVSIRASLIDEASRAASEDSSNIEDPLGIEAGIRERGYINEQIYRAYVLGASEVESAIKVLAEEEFFSASLDFCQIFGGAEPLEGVGQCKHAFCKECLEDYIDLKVKDAEVLSLACPHFQCTTVLTGSFVRRMTSPQVYEKYLSFKRNAELEAQPNVRFCPRVNCSGYAVIGMNSASAVCNVCFFRYCADCLMAEHPGEDCPQEEDSAMRRYVKSHRVKECPNCKRKVEKIEGCDQMTCFKCKHEFCWLCGFPYLTGHFEECPALLYRRKVPRWSRIGFCFVLPLLLPLAMPILSLYYYNEIENEFREDFACFFRSKCRAKLLLALLSFLLTPIVVVLALPIYTVYSVSKYLNSLAEEQLVNTEAWSCSSDLYLSSLFRGSVSLLAGVFVLPVSMILAYLPTWWLGLGLLDESTAETLL
jgi:hypothetical protein